MNTPTLLKPLVLLVAAALVCACSSPSARAGVADLRITEVDPANGLVEVTHLPEASDFVLTNGLVFCYRFNYSTVIPAGSVFRPGRSLVFKLTGLDPLDSDVWLYRDMNFGSPSSLITGLKYGPQANVGRTSVAVAAGVWPDVNVFLPAPTPGQSVQALSFNDTRTTNWFQHTPDLGSYREARTGAGALRIPEVEPATGRVEVTYEGDVPFTTATALPFCHRFNYATSIPAGTPFEPGESRTITVAGLNATDSDLWLYRNASFASSSSIITGLKYGPQANVGRTSVATAAGLWPGTSFFISAPAAGQSLQLTIAANPTGPTNWVSAPPRFGSFTPTFDALGSLVITEVDPTRGLVEVMFAGLGEFRAPANLPFCHRFNYMSFVPVGTRFCGFDPVVFPVADLDASDSDLWLYRDGNFGSPASIITGIKYGPSPNVGRTSVAVAAGIWPSTSAFVPAPVAGESLHTLSSQTTDVVSSWFSGLPTLGELRPGPSSAFRVTSVAAAGDSVRVDFAAPTGGPDLLQVETRPALNASDPWTDEPAVITSEEVGQFHATITRNGRERLFIRITARSTGNAN